MLAALPSVAGAAIRVPSGFEVATLAGPTRADTPRLEAIRNSAYGEGVIAAFMDGTTLRLRRVSESGVAELISTPGFEPGSRVADIRFDTSRTFGNRLFLTVASPMPSGVAPLVTTQFFTVAPDGSTKLGLTLGDARDAMVLLMDFTPAVNGYLAGVYLVDANPAGGSSLLHADSALVVTSLASHAVPAGRRETMVRGVEFDPNGDFRDLLVMADSDPVDDFTGILTMKSNLAFAGLGTPVSIVRREYGDMAISPRADFGTALYATGKVADFVFVVDPGGLHETFAKGFAGVESITIDDAGQNMYVSDANGVHRIRVIPTPPVVVACGDVSAGVVTTDTNAIVNVGQALIGRALGDNIIVHTGLVACVAATTVEAIAGDCNADRLIDLDDYGCFFDCVTGEGGGIDPGCSTFDFDFDVDVDTIDWHVLQTLFTVVVGP